MSDDFSNMIKDRYSVEDLLEIMKILRSPKGCAWDREQNHKSIRRDFLEECYEAVEAIDSGDTKLLKEELGDVLLQVVFHCRIEEENSSFCFDDIVNDLCLKLILRHPHVFNRSSVSGVDDILENWDEIKRKSKGQKSLCEVLQSVTPAMPALMRFQKVVKKAEKAGVMTAVNPTEEIHRLSKKKLGSDEIAEILALAVMAAADINEDAEELLSKKTESFIESVK